MSEYVYRFFGIINKSNIYILYIVTIYMIINILFLILFSPKRQLSKVIKKPEQVY